MIRTFYAVPVLVCLGAGFAMAQAPQQPATEKPAAQAPATPRPATPPPPAAQQPARPSEMSTTAANKVTYTGCLKPGTAAGTWVLESAEVAQKAGTAPSTVGTSGSSKMAFNLEPAATVNLTPHANHKVEVVGVVSPAKAGAEAAPSAAASASAAAPRQQFSVESFKMVSATCP